MVAYAFCDHVQEKYIDAAMKGASGDEELIIMSLRGLIIFYAPSPVVRR